MPDAHTQRLKVIGQVRDVVGDLEDETRLRNEWDWENPVYDPKPVDLNLMTLTEELDGMVEMLARGLHSTWMEGLIADGWSRASAGQPIDEKSKLHPNLVDWDLLPDAVKEPRLRDSVLTLKIADAAKCTIATRSMTSRKRTEVPKDLHQLREIMAVQYHELWVKDQLWHQWSYGPTLDDQLKRHPIILPWYMLDMAGRSKDIEAAEATILNMLNSGCAVTPPRTKQMLITYPTTSELSMQVESFNTFIVDRLESHFDIEIDSLERHGDKFDVAIFVHFREDEKNPKKAEYKGTKLLQGKNVSPPSSMWVPANPKHTIEQGMLKQNSSFPGLSPDDLYLRIYCIHADPDRDEILQIIKEGMNGYTGNGGMGSGTQRR